MLWEDDEEDAADTRPCETHVAGNKPVVVVPPRTPLRPVERVRQGKRSRGTR